MTKEKNLSLAGLESKVNRLDRYWSKLADKQDVEPLRRVEKWRSKLELKLRSLQDAQELREAIDAYSEAYE